MEIAIISFALILFIGVLLNSGKKTNYKNSTLKKTTHRNIPEKYAKFPLYDGKMYKKPIETSAPNYDRLTIFFKGTPNLNYIDTLLANNYKKVSEVRYEKDNTYVILELMPNKTKIAYHIKK